VHPRPSRAARPCHAAGRGPLERAAVIRRLALVALAASLPAAGCAGGARGRATVWITLDRGARVVRIAHVPANLTAMQGLERVAKVSTRYGGRYVQSIDGIAGSLSHQRDWFYFVNGYEADRSAAEYRLHAGDVEWWDFRGWRNAERVPVVVGAFPEPFLHGWNGRTRPTVVEHDAATRTSARRIARRLHARLVPLRAHVDRNANVVRLWCPAYPPATGIRARLRFGGGPGSAVILTSTCADANLERRVQHRYEVGRP
jgi:hypothetical protein